MARLGILGGTFNPPHLGHLILGQEAHLQLELDEVLFMPAGQPPHKHVEGDVSALGRLQMTRLACAGDERFTVSDYETTKAGLAYTSETLAHLARSGDDLFFILGGDEAALLNTWHQPDRVLALATLGVVERRGWRRSEIERTLNSIGSPASAAFIGMPPIALSSTAIRDRVARGEPIDYWVPPAVAHYIAGEGIYRVQ